MSDLQRTEEWFADRCGKFTASRFVDVMARSKKDGKPLKACSDMIWQIVVERMTGQPSDSVDSYAMRWGREVESYAREAYEFETGLIVTESGFMQHPEYQFVGCSPDGLVGADGGLEMKCPKDSAIHLQRYIDGIGDEFMPQVQGCMWVTGRKWWDWVSYDPRMPESHRLLTIRVERDDSYIDKLKEAVIEANHAAELLIKQLGKKAASAMPSCDTSMVRG